MTNSTLEQSQLITVLYTDLSDLPLYNWIETAVSGNLKWLVKSGPIPDDLEAHYSELLAEYQSLVKDAKSSNDHSLKVTYALLANRIDHVNIALNALRMGRDADIIRILQTPHPDGLGFERLTYDDLEKDIKLTENFLRMDMVKLNQAKAQLEKIFKTAGDTDGVNSKGMFYEQITSLSKWLQFGINPKETSVIQYISYLNALMDEVKRNENKK
jgi:hypothetical protein